MEHSVMPSNIAEILDELLIKEIVQFLPHPHPISRNVRRFKPSLVETILSYTQEELALLYTAATTILESDRPRNERTASAEADVVQEIPQRGSDANDNFKNFLQIVDEALILGAFRSFRDCTENMALAVEACSACARHTNQGQLTLFSSPLDIPNYHILRPRRSHPKHTLFNGILLHGRASKGKNAVVCIKCLSKLKHGSLLPLALANGLWIGDIPFQLEVLTLAEKLLIARYYSAAYVIKLYPKDPSLKYWDPKLLNSGLKGNMSTYPLDTMEVSRYMNQTFMPPPLSVLSATIAITFIGPRDFPKKPLPDILKNNPLYSDIVLAEERLRDLPADSVPKEIRVTAKYSTDIEGVMQEHESYMPNDNQDNTQENAEGKGNNPELQPSHGINNIIDYNNESGLESSIDSHQDPAMIPLQSQGVIDVTSTSIPDMELLSHAFADTALNVPAAQNLNIHQGSPFINEYACHDPITGEWNDGGPGNPNHLQQI
ncbi:hypothetical protein NP233_g9822 [Leucocoprinus birnbaumii]|uniref:DUF6570 domain-containing protein n=1 Tax=Leucocoprinus birnbaumii TaxID=56174 RepID=A0AAD5YMU5_9AGAR|nr:hypothetical protein NP233_g9822 [Leucocoprinus birnbaumii]